MRTMDSQPASVVDFVKRPKIVNDFRLEPSCYRNEPENVYTAWLFDAAPCLSTGAALASTFARSSPPHTFRFRAQSGFAHPAIDFGTIAAATARALVLRRL